ncbi:hypothetical protein ACP70R_033376 [Stipagrostis hirtigluma subsp. patula]
MEAPLHHSPVPTPPPPQQQQQQHQFDTVGSTAAHAMTVVQKPAPSPATMAGREQCPRCASRDTKFCYYNNYNTAQPRHFCRACRRYWTLGGSLRNVPFGGSARKRPRPARPTRAIAAAVAAATTSSASAIAATTATTSVCGPFASPVASPTPAPAQSGGGLLTSLLLGSAPLLALGAAPMLEGRLGVDLGHGHPLPAATGAGDLMAQLGFSAAGPLLWPAAPILEGATADTTTWKAGRGVLPPPAAAALWQELAAAPAPVEAGGLHHGAP